MTGADLSGLTPREREVALTAAEGLATRDVAERLYLSPRTVEHHLSAAYRKLGVSTRSALVALLRDHSAGHDSQALPATRYAANGDDHVAYQVTGDGRRDIVFIPGFVSNVEAAWTWPAQAGFLRRLAAGRRLIMFDKRGTGLSDPVKDPGALPIEERMEDVRAVMDAAGSSRATLFGFSEGAAMAMLFAATYPSRTDGLILYGALISPTIDPEASPFSDPAAAWEMMRKVWGTGRFLAPFVPSLEGMDSELEHVARFERHGASPAAAFTIFRMAATVELRFLCPAVHAPCLVLHRRDDVLVPSGHGRYLAEHLPDARYVELDGRDHPPWIGQNEVLLEEVDRFLDSEHPVGAAPGPVLQALVMADRALSPGLLSTVERFRGRPAASARGVLYTFEGTLRATECAIELAARDPSLRLIVHAGELRVAPGAVGGASVDAAGAALGVAAPGDVTVTGVVKELLFGSGLEMRPGPEVQLPGGAGAATLFVAQPAGSGPVPSL